MPTRRLWVSTLVLATAVALLLFWTGRWTASRTRIVVRPPLVHRALPLQLSGVNHPIWVELVSDQPRIALFHHFLLPAECQAMIDLATPRLSPSTVQSTTLERSPDRTSYTTNLERRETPLVASLEERVALIANQGQATLEPLQVVRYEPAQFYKPHYDYFVPGARGTTSALRHGGQRTTTVFVYLNDLDPSDTGGATYFPKLKLRIRPEQGTALLFSNLQVDGTPDTQMLHAGEPPTRSVKYGLNAWFREGVYQ